jgi:hypothetical protein
MKKSKGVSRWHEKPILSGAIYQCSLAPVDVVSHHGKQKFELQSTQHCAPACHQPRVVLLAPCKACFGTPSCSQALAWPTGQGALPQRGASCDNLYSVGQCPQHGCNKHSAQRQAVTAGQLCCVDQLVCVTRPLADGWLCMLPAV